MKLSKYANTDRQIRALELHLEGKGYRTIAKQLEQEGIVNSEGKKWHENTIKKDIKFILNAYMKEAAGKVETHRANHLMRAEYLWAQAVEEYLNSDSSVNAVMALREAHNILKTMIKLMGTEKPQQIEANVTHEVVPIGFLPVGLHEEI